jgi:hypothetical protein
VQCLLAIKVRLPMKNDGLFLAPLQLDLLYPTIATKDS